MIPAIDVDDIRFEPDITAIESKLADCALNFALLGQIQIAKSLINLLMQNGWTRGNWFSFECLKFAWHETGQWPEGWPDRYREIPSEAEFRRRRKIQWYGLPEGSEKDDQAGLEACLGQEDDQHADSSTGASAMFKGQRLVRALEISVKLHGTKPVAKPSADEEHSSKKAKGKYGQKIEQEDAGRDLKMPDMDAQSAEILNKIIPRWDTNQQVAYLSESKVLWPLWVRGLLADAGGIDKAELENKGQKLLGAFQARYTNGFAPSRLAGKSIKELLEIGNKNTIAYFKTPEGDHHDGDVETLFKQPATDEEIEELETRLETVLPDDYKEFLKISNGFGHEDSGIFNGYFPDPALYGTSHDINWNKEEYFQLPVDLLELGRDFDEILGTENKESTGGGFDWDTAFPLFDRVLECGVCDIDNLWLVHPQLVEQVREKYHQMYRKANEKQKKVILRAMESFAGSKEAFESMHWCFAKWSSGGSAVMSFYASFGHYLEAIVVDSMKPM